MENFKPFHDMFKQADDIMVVLRANFLPPDLEIPTFGTTALRYIICLQRQLQAVKDQLHLFVVTPSNLAPGVRALAEPDWNKLKDIVETGQRMVALIDLIKESTTAANVKDEAEDKDKGGDRPARKRALPQSEQSNKRHSTGAKRRKRE